MTENYAYYKVQIRLNKTVKRFKKTILKENTERQETHRPFFSSEYNLNFYQKIQLKF